MKNIKSKILVFIIIVLFLLSQRGIYAAMADYTDEQADQQMKEQQENWQKEQETKKNKSSDNYLKDLSVKGYKILPSFNKENTNYELGIEIEDDYIEIKTETEDEKATVTGNGKVILNSGENNLKVSVTAENGEERLYFIKTVKKNKNNLSVSLEDEEIRNYKIDVHTEEKKFLNKKNNNKDKKKFIILTISILTIIRFIKYFKFQKKSKHN